MTEHRLAQYRQSESRAVVLCVCGQAWSGPTMESVWDRFNLHLVQSAWAGGHLSVDPGDPPGVTQ